MYVWREGGLEEQQKAKMRDELGFREASVVGSFVRLQNSDSSSSFSFLIFLSFATGGLSNNKE